MDAGAQAAAPEQSGPVVEKPVVATPAATAASEPTIAKGPAEPETASDDAPEEWDTTAPPAGANAPVTKASPADMERLKEVAAAVRAAKLSQAAQAAPPAPPRVMPVAAPSHAAGPAPTSSPANHATSNVLPVAKPVADPIVSPAPAPVATSPRKETPASPADLAPPVAASPVQPVSAAEAPAVAPSKPSEPAAETPLPSPAPHAAGAQPQAGQPAAAPVTIGPVTIAEPSVVETRSETNVPASQAVAAELPAATPKPQEPAGPAQILSMTEAEPVAETGPATKQEPVAEAAPSDSAPAAPEASPAVAVESPPADPVRVILGESIVPQWEVDNFQWPSVCTKLESTAAPQLALLAEQLLQAASAGQQVIGLAGVARGEGCTTMTLMLARQLRDAGARVVLVDADLGDPDLATALGMKVETGLLDALDGQMAFDDAVVASLGDRMAVVPMERPMRVSQAARQRPAVAAVLDALRAEYDVVLIDGGTGLAREHAWFDPATRPVDAVLLVHDVTVTSAAAARGALDLIAAAGMTPLGIIENFAAASDEMPAAPPTSRAA